MIQANADLLLPPVTSMTSVRPSCPSRVSVLRSTQAVWPTMTLSALESL